MSHIKKSDRKCTHINALKYNIFTHNVIIHQQNSKHQDKTSTYTSQSIVNFLKEIKHEMCMKSEPFTNIPAKFLYVSTTKFWTLKNGIIKTPAYSLSGTFANNSRGMGEMPTEDIIVKEITAQKSNYG